MITSRKSLVYPDPTHCYREELTNASSHEYDMNEYTTFEDIHNTLDSDGFSTILPPSPWNLPSPVLTSSYNKYQAWGSHLIDRPAYPSPPPTSSRPGRSVPLPNDSCKTPYSVAVEQPLECRDYLNEVPDSSSIIRQGSQRYREPLSPPPTLPIQSLTLPSADCDMVQLDEMEDSEECPDFLMSHPYKHLNTSHGTAHHRLPSPPLSPDWTNVKVAGGASYLAPLQNSLFIQDILPPIENDFHSYDLNELYGQPSTLRSWQQHDNINEHNSSKDPDILLTSFHTSSNPSNAPEVEDGLFTTWDYTSHKFFPPPGSPLVSSPASSDHDSDFRDYEDGFMSPPSSPSLRSVSELPMLEDEGDDHLGLSSPFNDVPWNCGPPPSSESNARCYAEKVPSIRSFPGVETDEDLIPVDLASRSWAPEHCIVIPSTPYITPTTLIPMPGSSSWVNSLHETTANFGSNSLLLVDDHTARSPFSSSSRIGAELDQLDPNFVASDAELKQLLDLRSRALASERQARMVEAQYKNIKAFWLRDVGKDTGSNDGISMDGSGMAEEMDVHDIQRHLHQEEARMQAMLGMQAKRSRKREKERVREVSALVKINLTERGVSFKKTLPGSPTRHVKDEDVDVDGICVTDVLSDHTHKCGHRTKSDKGDITTMPQLVARMILRRREARLRPLTRPRPGRSSEVPSDPSHSQYSGQPHRRSSLALCSSTDPEQITMTQDDILPCIGHCQPQHPSLNWHMDVDCHTCPYSVINNLDDLDINSQFDLLSLSNT